MNGMSGLRAVVNIAGSTEDTDQRETWDSGRIAGEFSITLQRLHIKVGLLTYMD